MIEVKPDKKLTQEELEQLVDRVFFKVIDLVGGIKKLAEFRSLTWLPSLARAVYIVILKNEYLKPDEEIASQIGISTNTVKTILRANPDAALEKLKETEIKKELRIHTAGALAKLAYNLVREGKESKILIEFCKKWAVQESNLQPSD